MKPFTFDNRWDEISGKLKQRYGQLADDDLTFAEGKTEELYGRLRERLGMSQDELEDVLGEMHDSLSGRMEEARERAGEMADEVRQRASEAAGAVKAQAGAAYDRTRDRARTLLEDGEEYVRHNPRESLVVALFAGFVAGLLIRH